MITINDPGAYAQGPGKGEPSIVTLQGVEPNVLYAQVIKDPVTHDRPLYALVILGPEEAYVGFPLLWELLALQLLDVLNNTGG